MELRTQRLLLVSAAIVLSGGAALGAGVSAPAPAPGSEADQPQQPVGTADSEQTTYFEVERRSGPGDPLPEPASEVLSDGPTPDLGANPSLARRALTTASGVTAYVVPARGYLCLVTSNGFASCNRTSEARKGFLVAVEEPADGSTRVIGMVPDGAGTVTLRGADGGAERTSPESNAFAFETGAPPKQLEWTGPDGRHVVPLESRGVMG